MKTAALLALLAVVASASSASAVPRDDDRRRGDWDRDRGGHGGYEVMCPRDVDAAFAALDVALYQLADEVDDLRGRDQRRLRDNLAALAEAAEAARDQSCRRRPPVIVQPPPPPPPPPRAIVMDGPAHLQLVKAMRAESFDEGRLRLLDTAVRGDICLTAPQTKELMRTVSFSSGRLDVLRRLAPRLVDDGQAIVIYQALDFTGDKEDAAQVLASAKTIPACRLPYK